MPGAVGFGRLRSLFAKSEAALRSTAGASHDVQASIDGWKTSEGAEHANVQSFAVQLCRLLAVAEPEAPHRAETDRDIFAYPVTFRHVAGTAASGRCC